MSATERPPTLGIDASSTYCRREDRERYVLCHESRQNAYVGIRLVKHHAILHFSRSPARAALGAVEFVDTLAEKLKYVFLLGLEINELAKCCEKKKGRRVGERKEIPEIESLHMQKHVKSREENSLHGARIAVTSGHERASHICLKH